MFSCFISWKYIFYSLLPVLKLKINFPQASLVVELSLQVVNVNALLHLPLSRLYRLFVMRTKCDPDLCPKCSKIECLKVWYGRPPAPCASCVMSADFPTLLPEQYLHHPLLSWTFTVLQKHVAPQPPVLMSLSTPSRAPPALSLHIFAPSRGAPATVDPVRPHTGPYIDALQLYPNPALDFDPLFFFF